MGETGFLAVVGKWKGVDGLVGLINMYGLQGESDKNILWDKIGSALNTVNASRCFFGDFNEVRGQDERFNSVVNDRSSRIFNDFVTSEDLLDISLGGRKLTD